jgi:hypothetical protein
MSRKLTAAVKIFTDHFRHRWVNAMRLGKEMKQKNCHPDPPEAEKDLEILFSDEILHPETSGFRMTK